MFSFTLLDKMGHSDSLLEKKLDPMDLEPAFSPLHLGSTALTLSLLDGQRKPW